MIMNVYSIFDDKAKAYAQPFFLLQHGQAIRAFGDEVGNPQSSINKHPSDYHLYLLGEYDDISGKFKSLDSPIFLSHGVDFVKDVVK